MQLPCGCVPIRGTWTNRIKPPEGQSLNWALFRETMTVNHGQKNVTKGMLTISRIGNGTRSQGTIVMHCDQLASESMSIIAQ